MPSHTILFEITNMIHITYMQHNTNGHLSRKRIIRQPITSQVQNQLKAESLTLKLTSESFGETDICTHCVLIQHIINST